MTRIMAIDYGQARIGIAITDPSGKIALPSGRIECKKMSVEERIKTVLQMAVEKGVSTIVVGIPKKLDGSLSEQTKLCIQFLERLQEMAEGTVKISSFDERLSSRQADQLLKSAEFNRKKRHKHIDETSAWVILDSYLQAQNPTIPPPPMETR